MFGFNAVRQIRSAVSLLSPDEVRSQAERPLAIGLVASSIAGYADMEDFLAHPGMERSRSLEKVFRQGDAATPADVDIYLYEEGLACPADAFTFRRAHPETTVTEILEVREDLRLALARSFPVFRKPVVDRIVREISKENALFAVVSALPNIVPTFLDLPWAVGEFASDTAFISLNQVRMAFLIAAACGKKIGLTEQTTEVISIAAGAFGWRALARELVGKIPLGGGLIPKGAIAYAGTFVIGKGMERLHELGQHFSRKEQREVYRAGYQQGEGVAKGLVEQPRM